MIIIVNRYGTLCVTFLWDAEVNLDGGVVITLTWALNDNGIFNVYMNSRIE